MKCIIALLLSMVLLLTGCTHIAPQTIENSVRIPAPSENIVWEDVEPQYDSLDDPALLQYIEDNIYAELAIQFGSDEYIIENITAAYISQEYLDETAFNSQSNIFFGYTIAELDDFFQGTRYIFTLDDDGQTTVQEMQIIEDISVERIIKNVSLGTGVILVCVTVSYFTSGTGIPTAANLIFTAAAKTGTSFALSSGAISGFFSGIIRGYQTGDVKEAFEAAALAGSEDFKWGAITGVISGGGAKALSIYRSSKVIPTPRESELKVLDTTNDAVEQISYLNGKQVSTATPGSTRPDIVVQNANGTVRAIEVKNYNLESSANRNGLLSELKRQVADRTKHLPKGSTQEIVLDVRGRGYSTKLIDNTIKYLQKELDSIYSNIPISVLRY